ncbi:MAG: GTP-binding protein [uncultured Sulfurovum sp.]|uniref:GTP-binding protein n=1 Tax=uncultured Sulfurovum sp. TaxID=269237 RepID=A0A6S6UIE2_9BACT|nr:MAG: GTP-binding protein [uncultured Sulfurovum sp.]
MIRKKILLLGDFAVGKTSLIRRYVDNAFDDSYLTTIGVKISKKLFVMNEIEVEMIIWDVEGTTPTKVIPLHYLKGASGAIFVTDVNRSETLLSLETHKNDFFSQNPEASFVVAHNKADLLSTEQKKQYENDEDTFLTSAKDNINVENIFSALFDKML